MFELYLPKTKFFEKTQKMAKNGNFEKPFKIVLDIVAKKLHAKFYDRTMNGFRDMMYLSKRQPKRKRKMRKRKISSWMPNWAF